MISEVTESYMACLSFLSLRPLYLLLLIGFLTITARGEVSTPPPKTYEERIRPVLTPFSAVKEKPDAFLDKNEPGRIALMERITWVQEDGKYFRAIHNIYQPYTQKGAEIAANDRYPEFSTITVKTKIASRRISNGRSIWKSLQNSVFRRIGHRSVCRSR